MDEQTYTRAELLAYEEGKRVVRLHEVEPLQAENKRLKEELTKKPEWTEQDYIERFQAENELLKEIITISDTRYELSERIRVVQDEQIDRLKNLLREVGECGVTDYDPEYKRIDYIEVQIDRDTWAKIKAELGEEE